MKNRKNREPNSRAAKFRPLFYQFPISRPIFWGPNQLTEANGLYNEPTGWKNKIAIKLPQVVRFFFGDDHDPHFGFTPYDTWTCTAYTSQLGSYRIPDLPDLTFVSGVVQRVTWLKTAGENVIIPIGSSRTVVYLAGPTIYDSFTTGIHWLLHDINPFTGTFDGVGYNGFSTGLGLTQNTAPGSNIAGFLTTKAQANVLYAPRVPYE